MVKSGPLKNERARRTAFFKRKDTIIKKTRELSTLCGVRACVICFAPDGKVETWPENPSQVKSVLDVYRDHQINKQPNKTLLSNWSDDWLGGLSLTTLNGLLGLVDSMLQNLETRIAEFQNKGENGATEPLFCVDPTVINSGEGACGWYSYNPQTFTVGDFNGSSESSLPLCQLNYCNGEIDGNSFVSLDRQFLPVMSLTQEEEMLDLESVLEGFFMQTVAPEFGVGSLSSNSGSGQGSGGHVEAAYVNLKY